MPNENDTPATENPTPTQGAENESGASQTGATGPDNGNQNAALDAEIAAKEAKKANLDKAIEEAEEDLRKKRQAAKQPAKNEEDDEEEEEETPTSNAEIDFNDPAAKAWDQHIKKNVSPIQAEREAEKAEIRKFTIKEFLADKPAIARDPEKVKELIGMYDRIKTNTGLTKEGVRADLSRAFGALYHEELIDASKNQKFDRVKEMQLFSDPGIDHGATGYTEEKTKTPNLSAEDKKQLAAWGLTPEQWAEMQANQSE